MFALSNFSRWTFLLCAVGAAAACGAAPEPSELAEEGAAASESDALCRHKPRDISLPSNTDWNAYSSAANGTVPLGKAEQVCLNATSPVACPVGATDYGYTGTGWAAHIDACGGQARWIWAPGTTAASGPAELVGYSFQKRVSVAASPAVALVHLTADDFAEVLVNGTAVGSVGSTTDAAVSAANQSTPTDIDIATALVPGINTIAIRAVNGPGEFAGCSNCTYQQNPAAVAFCVDIRF